MQSLAGVAEIQTCGQLTLWEENCENQIVDDEDIEKDYRAFSQYKNYISLYEALAAFLSNMVLFAQQA